MALREYFHQLTETLEKRGLMVDDEDMGECKPSGIGKREDLRINKGIGESDFYHGIGKVVFLGTPFYKKIWKRSKLKIFLNFINEILRVLSALIAPFVFYFCPHYPCICFWSNIKFCV